ncbi:NAD(P)/FAD-dependent oxidoreductase [Streptomyces sp. NPDC057638]|uniref:NAD(P)/FAD-dependent oxidoreductase n=1 Tax=Streptomyces sp. NPDC057638 TaxID=3346190 RepID=UPI0036B19FA5
MSLRHGCDVVIVGAGVVGAACAFYAVRAGLRPLLIDRGGVAGGTTGAGEGNLLVSDKEPGPELRLALLSLRLWRDLAEESPSFATAVEYRPKGGLVVAGRPAALAALTALAAAQRAEGVDARTVTADGVTALEPLLAPGFAGAVHYPQDSQVMPALAAAHWVRAARRLGADLWTGTEVVAVVRDRSGRVQGVRTTRGDVHAPAVVNAAGVWGAELAARAGLSLPVRPRRGVVLVTEPLPPRVIRHKVYAADYVGDVASDTDALRVSPVVESTEAGPVLIGSSREHTGFDRRLPTAVTGALAARATALFPFLGRVQALRAYLGFRPSVPDHLPVIGPDPRAPGLHHACGHEGAGVGLAPGTALLITRALCGEPPELDPAPFRPTRFGDPPALAYRP